MKNQIIKLVSVFIVAISLMSCSKDDNNTTIAKLPTILEIAKADPSNFSILTAALNKTQLTPTVSGPGSYTVFAPTNAAFAVAGFTEAGITALDPSVLADATTIATLKRVLQNHILGTATKAEDLLVAGYVKTFAAGVGTTTLSMFVNKVGSDVLVNGGSGTDKIGGKVTSANIDASNGIVHVVDGVLKLPKLVDHIKINPNLSTLLSVVATTAFGDQSAVLTLLNTASTNATYASNNTNPSITLFAPLNSAFTAATASGGFLTGANFDPATNLAANVTKVLQYHVSQSGTFTAPLTAIPGNLSSSSATSWTATTATTDATIRTLAQNAVPATQTFKIAKGTLKITEFPVIVAPATVPVPSIIKTVNIQATNGIIHTIDRVLQPVL